MFLDLWIYPFFTDIASSIWIPDLLPNYTDLSKFLFRMSNEHAAGVKHPCYGQMYLHEWESDH